MQPLFDCGSLHAVQYSVSKQRKQANLMFILCSLVINLYQPITPLNFVNTSSIRGNEIYTNKVVFMLPSSRNSFST